MANYDPILDRNYSGTRAENRNHARNPGSLSAPALAEKWKLSDEIREVIAHHHNIEQSQKAGSLVAMVHLSDLLCRMHGLGYGYYERHKVDLIADPAWAVLLKEHRDLEGVDLARFTFELDESVEEIHALVTAVFGSSRART